MNATVVAVIVLVLIGAYAIRGTMKRVKGGGCHGGGAMVAEPEKKLEGEVLGSREFKVEGMHCPACKSRVEHVINNMEGAACKVDLGKHTATVSYDRDVDFDEVVRRIDALGYEVVK